MRRFLAPTDRALRVSTALVIVVLAVAGLGLPAFALSNLGAAGGAIVLLVCAVPSLAAGVLGAMLAPRAFALEGSVLRVERALSPIAVRLASVRAVGLLPDDALRRSIRVGGSSGFFGYYGRFRSRALGSYRLYARRRGGYVLVDTDRERFVLAPERPERFVEAVLAAAPAARRAGEAPSGAEAPPGRSRLRDAAVPLAVVGAALVVAAVIFGVSWMHSPVAAAVESHAVVVARRAAGPVVIPLAKVTEARVVAPEELRGARRVVGVATGKVRYGSFRSDGLGAFTLYAWRRGPYVLLETANGRVVLSPEDGDGFVAAVRERSRR